MTLYARKDESGAVIELIEAAVYPEDVYSVASEPTEEFPDGVEAKLLHKAGDEIPIEARFHPDFVATLVEVPASTKIVAVTPPEPTSEEKASAIFAQRDRLLEAAALRIAPLQDAVDLEDASAGEAAALKAWKQYRVKLLRIDQAADFPDTITWPKEPK